MAANAKDEHNANHCVGQPSRIEIHAGTTNDDQVEVPSFTEVPRALRAL